MKQREMRETFPQGEGGQRCEARREKAQLFIQQLLYSKNLCLINLYVPLEDQHLIEVPCLAVCGSVCWGTHVAQAFGSQKREMGEGLVKSRPASWRGGRQAKIGPAGGVRGAGAGAGREARQPIWNPVLRPCLPGWGLVGLCPFYLSVWVVCSPGIWSRQWLWGGGNQTDWPAC